MPKKKRSMASSTGWLQKGRNNMEPIFQTVKAFCATSGLSVKKIREGCKAGTIPHIRVGEGENARFMVNVPLYLEQLNKESLRHE